MAIDNANFISELNPGTPLNVDPRTEGAGQIRATKYAVQQSFPNVDAPVTATSAEMNDIFTNSQIHIGMVMIWVGTTGTEPAGWVPCDGKTYDIIGGSQLTIPDMRGMFVRGAHETIVGDPGVVPPIPDQPAEVARDEGGENFKTIDYEVIVDGHVLTLDQIPAHAHEIGTDPGSSSVSGDKVRSESQETLTSTTSSVGGGLEHAHTAAIDPLVVEYLPTYFVVTYIMYVGVGSTVQP